MENVTNNEVKDHLEAKEKEACPYNLKGPVLLITEANRRILYSSSSIKNKQCENIFYTK